MTDNTPRGATRGWSAPDPRQLPDIRAALADYTMGEESRMNMRTMIDLGRSHLLPYFPRARGATAESYAAAALCASERARLWSAKVYSVNADMTSLALALGSKPPKVPMKPSRAPSLYGFMMFEEPIGGYTMSMTEHLTGSGFRAAADITVTTPIVAVSWSPFDPQMVEGVDSEGDPVRWARHDRDGSLVPIPLGHPGGVWLTFYSPNESPFSALPPDTVVCYAPDGTPMTASDLADPDMRRGAPLVQWDNEMVLTTGAPWSDPPEPDTSQQWAQVVYRAWQAMTQSGKRSIAEGEMLARDRAARRRDARAGGYITAADNDVRLVRLHAKHRPPRAAIEQDAAASTGRRAPSWSCRWPVPPYPRNQCFNPRGHQSGDCEHDEVIVGFHVKGPADKPLRMPNTTYLWDRMPDGWDGLVEGEE